MVTKAWPKSEKKQSTMTVEELLAKAGTKIGRAHV